MIQIDDTLVSDELFSERFVCDLSACKGACCVEGESGAPLDVDEIDILEESLEQIKPYMRKEGLERIEETGVFTVDDDGEFVTPLVNDRECAFVNFDSNGIAKCSIEMAYRDGKTNFPKPISCHLYPIRLTELKDFVALNYHYWPICDPARSCGAKLDVKVFRFLKGPIIRRFGEEYYDKLEAADRLLNKGASK
jgi:hypothetical protein